ncbi:hypothetical protein CTEN210_15328 [Chaetoceros tenuissimus]|uniref:Uncharacterized protein n=1 Tax=Chaetoceros tenuissimus TaxID=426638 RepID=A0AAD3D7G3_9STRA|nr:hypothetical protein CTEN210_15328 [Chaetoceros tenuissimus]
MSYSKRKHGQEDQSIYANEVDDLAFAATFAIVTTPDIPLQETKEVETKEEIDIDDEDESSSDESEDEKDPANAVRDNQVDDESSDDESEVDLTEELREIEKMEDQTKGAGKTQIVIPTTQNEVDLYNCPVNELEKRLNLDLGVSDVMLFHPTDRGIMHAKVTSDRIHSAGKLKFHMVSERTIVVESNNLPTHGINAYVGAMNLQSSLLDEGSILLLKFVSNDEIIAKQEFGEISLAENEICVIPVGKILEVFGPVAKPLYTLRLSNNKHTSLKSDETKDGKGDEESNSSKREDQESNDNKVSETDIAPEKSAASNEASSKNIVDPWTIDGVLTKWLQANKNIEMFYSEDQVKMVDTQIVVKNSRKGCDASNMHDEEVTDVKDMYFSDDEEERALKKGKKKKNRNMNELQSNMQQGNHNRQRGNFTRNNNSYQAPQQPYNPSSQTQTQYQQYNQPMYHQQPPGQFQQYPNQGVVPTYQYAPQHQQQQHQQQPQYTYPNNPQPHVQYQSYAPPPPVNYPHQTFQNTGVPPPPPPPPRAQQPTAMGYGQPPPNYQQAQLYPNSQYQQPPPQPYPTQYNQVGQGQNQQQNGNNNSDTVYYNYSGK